MTVQLTGQKTAATFDVTQPDGTVSITDPDQSVTLTLKANAEGTFAEGIVLPSDDYGGMTLHLILADGGFFNWTLNRRLLQLDFEQLPRSHAIQGGTQIHLQHHREPHRSVRNLHHQRLDTRQRRER